MEHICVTAGLAVSVDVATVCGDAIMTGIVVRESVIVTIDVTEEVPTFLANFCQLVAFSDSTLVTSLD